MKTTIDFHQFANWFQEHRPHNFSRAGLQGLFDYLEDYEDDTDESIEFDPIALCVEYTEYQDLDEFHQSYDKEEYPDLDEIRDWTQVIELGNESFIIHNF
tara:strand:+ start:1466 stop:1765 length:300 start_codon:yes stop_codon:yes gene_type:complete